MKKSLFLLPLLGGFVLAGCEFTLFGKTIKLGGDSSETAQKPSSSTKPSGQTTDDDSSKKTDDSSQSVVVDGELIVDVSGDALSSLADQGYAACEGDHTVGSYTVNFAAGTMVNSDPFSLKSSTLNVIQLAKFGHDKYPNGGALTVKGIKPKKVLAKLVTKSNFSWGSNQMGTVTFGGKSVTVPGEATTTTGSYGDSKIHEVVLDVNASSEGDFVVSNTGKFAFYIVSLAFYK